MAINKVVYGNSTLIDLTEDTVSANNLLAGETAHDRSGASVVGSVVTAEVVDNLTTQDATKALSANQGYVLNQNKVDKVTGKGLSTNDYTNEDKAKVTSSDSKITNYEDRGYLGKNLLKVTARSTTTNGLTFTVNNDGSIKISGTATANTYFYPFGSGVPSNVIGNNVIVNGSTTGVAIRIYHYDGTNTVQSENGNDSPTVTISTAECIVDIRVASGTTVNTTIYPMLRLATGSTTFVPYVKSNIELDNKITHYENMGYLEKNLLNPDNIGHYGRDNSTGQIDRTENSLSSTTDLVKVSPSTKYTISRNGTSYGSRVFYYNSNKEYINNTVDHNKSVFTTPNNCYYVAFQSGYVSGALDLWCMVEGESTTYIPYAKSNIELDSAKIDKTASEIQTSDGQFTTVTGGLMQSCDIELEPIQNLHGYSKPWTGGSGKNKLPLTLDGLKAINTSGSWSGNTYTINGITFTINTDTNDNIESIIVNGTKSTSSGVSLILINTNNVPSNIKGQNIILSGCPSGLDNTNIMLNSWGTASPVYDTGNGVQTTFPASPTGIRSEIQIFTSNNFSNVVFKPMIRKATDSATFEPYTNICPISGHTQVQVGNVGKNWLNPTLATTTLNGITCTNNGDGTYTVSGTATADVDFAIQSFAFPSYIIGKNVKMVGCPSGGSGNTYRLQIRGTSFLDTGSGIISSYNLTYTNNLQIRISSGTVCNNLVFKPMLTLDTSATYDDYEPYNPNSYTTTINLGGTYYGGTLDAVSGKLTVTHGIIGANNFDTYASGTSGGGLHYVQKDSTGSKLNGNGICNMMAVDNQNAWTSTIPVAQISPSESTVGRIRVYCSSTSLSNFKSEYVGLQICYELATPITIQLTPTQLETLVGQNDVFAPLVGQTLESVEYREVLAIDDVPKAIPYENVAPDMGTGEDRTYFRIKKYGRLVQLEFIQSNYWMVVEQQTKVVFGVLPDGYYDKQPSSMLHPDVEFEYPFVNETATNQYDNKKLFINMVNGEVYSVYQANDEIHPMGSITYILDHD